MFIKKNNCNVGQNDGLYYFRDNVGNEVDLITERDGEPLAIEIKASLKVNSSMLRGLYFWQKNQAFGQSILIHGGKTNEIINDRIGIVPWTEVVNF